MKTITKKITLACLGAACVLSLSLIAGMLVGNKGFAKAEDSAVPDAKHFFYDNLLDTNNSEYTLAKRFYEVLDKLNKAGDFKDGVVDYNISDIVTSARLKAWIDDGNLEVPRAFAAARDAFITDHPEIFYINFYKLTISVGKSGGNYVGYLNSGREANLFYDNGFNTVESVAKAIKEFDAKVTEAVNTIKAELNNNKYSAEDVFLAREANQYIAKNIKYDYVAYDNKEDENYIAAAYINTPYGGLVENKAVCGGFSTSYKVIMDALGVPCITVNGYSNNKDEAGNDNGASVYHMWNYVWLKNPANESARAYALSRAANKSGEWYSIDTTWNSSASNKNRYSLLSATEDAKQHVPDGEVSSSGYKLRYPALSAHLYGSNGDTEGLQSYIMYNREGDLKDDSGEPLLCNYKTVSYNGKSAKRLLEEDGLYIVYRDAYYEKDRFDGDIIWSRWISLVKFITDVVEPGALGDPSLITDDGNETRFYDNTSVYCTQFAVFDVAPDGIDWIGTNGVNYGRLEYYYSDELANKITAVEKGESLVNQTYGSYTPAPYISKSSPSHQVKLSINDNMRDRKISEKAMMDEKYALTYTVTYDENLHVLDRTKPIGISFASEHPNTREYARFLPVNAKGEFVELVNDNTLKFKFAPSLMYEHNDEVYHFTFSNVGSAKIVTKVLEDGTLEQKTSDKVPNPISYNYARGFSACPARFNYDGRLWVDCCAQPTLVSNSDLSENLFKGDDGEDAFKATQKSQMMLVAEKADDATVDSMLDEISEHDGINVNKDDIHKSQTYDINLQVCGKVKKIPDGSYVKIALGFPEGYGPDQAGVTFKLFHRKHIQGDEYVIEEVPCVVTQFGIVATVTSFSPYMVAAVNADKATDKTVYASIDGNGGKLTVEDGKIRSLKQTDDSSTAWDDTTYTYTIQPDDGYGIYSVKLNGKEIKDRVVNGKLTLNYSDEDLGICNQLVIQYIADAAAARVQEKISGNVIDEAVETVKHIVEVKDQPVYSTDPLPELPGGNHDGKPAQSNNRTLIIVITVLCVVLAAAIAITTIVITVRKKNK